MSTVKPPKTSKIKTDDSNRFNLLTINPLRILFGYVILPMTDIRNHKSSAEFCHINQKEELFMPCLILLLSALLTSVQRIVLSGKIR